MRAVNIIAKKRDGAPLSRKEIAHFVQGFTRGEVPDYQAAAWLMAICCRGMNRREISDLTLEMAHSGDLLDLTDVAPNAVDKHSTGGVGDKVSLVVGPIVASLGLPVAKMSGRGLGFSGGTLDKLESINGFRADLTTREFLVNSIGRQGRQWSHTPFSIDVSAAARYWAGGRKANPTRASNPSFGDR